MSYVPRPRKLEGDFQKTLILVNGEPLDGKTTICQKILNESLGYISFDQMIWEDDLGIVELTERKKKSDKKENNNKHFVHVFILHFKSPSFHARCTTLHIIMRNIFQTILFCFWLRTLISLCISLKKKTKKQTFFLPFST